MRIRNVTNGLIIISDLPNTQGGSDLSIPAHVEVLLYNEDAEKSRQLGSFLTSGALVNLGVEEPTTGSPEAAAQPAVLGSYQITVTNIPLAGKALVATSPTTGEWQSTTGTLVFIDGETPGGLINGSNVSFTLANTPAAGSLHLYLNGLRQSRTVDYTIVGNVITFISAPTAPGKLVADYRL